MDNRTKTINFMSQDFSKRISIVVNKELASWQFSNTVAHIAAFLGNKMTDSFDTGKYFKSKDGILYPRNSQYPIITFSASEGELKNLSEKVRVSGLLYLAYVREMIDFTDDAELELALEKKSNSEIELLGIGIFGDNQVLKELTKKFSLWK